jgi:hypothetical protein
MLRCPRPTLSDISVWWFCRLPLDVSNRDSIIEAKKLIEEKEGRLHILVNKYVSWPSSMTRPFHPSFLVLESVDLA